MKKLKTIHSKEYKALTDWLRSCREEQGLTIRGLGERLNLSHSIVSKTETSDRRLDVIEYIQYCEALKVDPLEGMQIAIDKMK